MGKSIIVVTGPPSESNPIVARKISTWLGSPVILMHEILEGLRPVSLSFKEGELLDGLRPGDNKLQETPPMELARAALLIALRQVANGQADGGSKDSCFVLEFPMAEVVPKLLNILHEKLQVPLDRGLIIECIPPKEFYESRDHEMWRRHWSPILIAIEKLLSSKSEKLNSSFDRDRVSVLKPELGKDINPSLTGQSRSREEGGSHFSEALIEAADYWRPGLSGRKKGLDPHHEALPPFFQAVDHLIFKHDLEKWGPLRMTMREWGKYKIHYLKHPPDPNFLKVMMTLCFKGQGFHDMIDTTEFLPGAGVINKLSVAPCKLCMYPIFSGNPFYCCAFCTTYLHKACAELDGISRSKSFPSDLKKHVCPYCKIANIYTFSKDCRSCLYDTVVKSSPLPAIIHHPLIPQDFLQLQPCYHKDNENRYCAACDRTFKKEYRYFHKPSSLYYGAACVARLPLTIEHTHFGCRRPLTLRNSPHEEMDYYLCHFCMEERDSRHWYYFCDECQYTAHPYCLCPDEEEYH